MNASPASGERSSPWRAVLWIGLRPANPLEPSKRSPYHPLRMILKIIVTMLVMALVTFPIYSSVRLAKDSRAAKDEGQMISSALEHDAVRGKQREFLTQLEAVMDLGGQGAGAKKIPLPVSVVAPEPVQKALEERLPDHAISHAQPDCTGCVRLEWVRFVGWNYKVIPAGSSETVESTLAGVPIEDLEEGLKVFIRDGLELLPSPPRISLDPEQAYDALAEGVVLSLRFGAHLALGFVFLMLPFVMGGSIGLTWERNRKNASLEPLVFAYHPPWVMYLGEIIREGNNVLVFFLSALALVWAYGIPVHWPFLLSLLPLGLSLYVLSSVWGVWSTVLFHHPRGRMFAKFALSPMTIGGVWTLRVLMLWAAMKAFQPVRFIEQAENLLQGYPFLLLAVPPILLLALVVGLLTNKRIGRRREGLRETKFQ